MADFSVVIPAYNEGEQLSRTLTALGQSLEGRLTPEIIVVDDHSADDTPQAADAGVRRLQEHGLSAVVVRAAQRSGVAGAKNIGQLHATTPVSIFLDAHSVPGAGALESIAEPLLANEAAIVGPTFVALADTTDTEKITGVLNEVEPESLALPEVEQTIADMQAGYGRGQLIRDYSLTLEWMHYRVAQQGLQRVMIVPGGCTGVRTDGHGPNVFEGLFDTGFSFPWGAEDAELSLRTWRLGHVVASVPGAFVGTEFRSFFHFGTAGVSHVFNALRLVALFFSHDVFEQVVSHYVAEGWGQGVAWAMGQLLYRSDTVDRRRVLDDQGPPDLSNLLPVVGEFGGLDVVTGNDRRLIEWPQLSELA